MRLTLGLGIKATSLEIKSSDKNLWGQGKNYLMGEFLLWVSFYSDPKYFVFYSDSIISNLNGLSFRSCSLMESMALMADNSLFSELRKRKVIQAAVIYSAVAWGVVEIVVTVTEQLFLPQWVSTLSVIAFVVGFPVAMFLSWTFDITAEGIQRTTIGSRRGKASIFISMFLVVAGTASLFFLIKPSLDQEEIIRSSINIDSPPLNSIAIMPFENLSQNTDDNYLIEGLSDQLRDQLGQVEGLRIAARSSSITAFERAEDAREQSKYLGVAALVEGNMRRKGNLLQISIYLIEGSTGLAMWSQTIERGPQELLSVQQMFAEKIAEHFVSEEVLNLTIATRDSTANELMLLARYYEEQVKAQVEVDQNKQLEVVRLYREATQADPESALAHSRLAGALLYLNDVEAAEAPIFKAMSLDPGLSEVQATMGLYYWARGLPDAGAAFKRAVEINPNNADALSNYAYWFWFNTDHEHVFIEDLYRRALALDPLSLSRYGALGEFVGKYGFRDKTLEIVNRVEELFDDVPAYSLIAFLYQLTGDLDKSIAWTIRARDKEPNNPTHTGKLAELYTEIGDHETALKLEPEPGVGLLFKMRRYEELIDIAEYLMIEEPEDRVLRYLLAFAHNAKGNFEAAIHVLSTTGLPDSVLNSTPLATDLEGYMTLLNALYGTEIPDLMQEMAQYWIDEHDEGNYDWWENTYHACALSLAGRNEESLEFLQMATSSPRPAWEAFILDSTCFQKFQDDPIYQSVVQHYTDQRRRLREKLPTTLAEFGVRL